MNEEILQNALKRLPVNGLRYYPSIGSTNDAARSWAAQGGEDGALVVANTQTAGRGRFDRPWVTMPGSALAFSLLLRPDEDASAPIALYAPLGALALSLALEALGLQPQIKWPNDVLLDRRKVAGVLSEASWNGGRLEYVVLGIGVNVGLGSLPPPSMLQFPATSVEQALGRGVNREELLADTLEAFFDWRERLYTEAFIHAWERRLALRGEQVRLISAQSGEGMLSGTLLGVSDEGALRLRTASGQVEEALAGELHLRPVDMD